MYYYTLAQAGAWLKERTGLPVDESVLLQAGVVGSLVVSVPLVGRARSPTKYYRLEKVLMAVFDRLMADEFGDSPSPPIEFDPEQSDFEVRLLNGELVEELSPKERAIALISHNSRAKHLQDTLSVVDLGGFYVVPPLHLMMLESKGSVCLELVFSADGRESFQPHQQVGRDELRLLGPHLDRFAIEFEKINASAIAAIAPPKAEDPRQKSIAQEAEILKAIHALGLDPKRLPHVASGKAGTRSLVRKKMLIPSKCFVSVKAFDNAWDRALAEGAIEISAPP